MRNAPLRERVPRNTFAHLRNDVLSIDTNPSAAKSRSSLGRWLFPTASRRPDKPRRSRTCPRHGRRSTSRYYPLWAANRTEGNECEGPRSRSSVLRKGAEKLVKAPGGAV